MTSSVGGVSVVFLFAFADGTPFFVDGVALESCEGFDLELDDVRRCSRVDVLRPGVVPSPS